LMEFNFMYYVKIACVLYLNCSFVRFVLNGNCWRVKRCWWNETTLRTGSKRSRLPCSRYSTTVWMKL